MTGIFNNRGPKQAKPTRDTLTGKEYRSRYQCYKDLAESEELDPTYGLGLWELLRRHPLRFQDIGTGRLIDGHGTQVEEPNTDK